MHVAMQSTCTATYVTLTLLYSTFGILHNKVYIPYLALIRKYDT